MTAHRTPAQLYALVFGVALAAAGILGFISDSDFGHLGSGVQGKDFILFEVNGWHNVVHVVSGLTALAVATSARGARRFAVVFGVLYGAVTAWGFAAGDNVAGLIPVNTADNFLHLAIAALGLLAAMLSAPRRRSLADAG